MNKTIVLLTAAFFTGQAAFAQFGDSRQVIIHRSLLKCYESTMRTAETGAEYAKLITLAPGDGVLQYNYACFLEKANNVKGAIPHYQAAARLDPASSSQAHAQLGRIYMNMKNYQQALNEYSRAGAAYQPQVTQLQAYMQSLQQQRMIQQQQLQNGVKPGGAKLQPKKNSDDDDE